MRISVPTKMGFGTAPLGNMYRNIPEQEALDTPDAPIPAVVTTHHAGLPASK